MLLIGRHDYWPGYTPDVIRSLDYDYWPVLALSCDALTQAREKERADLEQRRGGLFNRRR